MKNFRTFLSFIISIILILTVVAIPMANDGLMVFENKEIQINEHTASEEKTTAETETVTTEVTSQEVTSEEKTVLSTESAETTTLPSSVNEKQTSAEIKKQATEPLTETETKQVIKTAETTAKEVQTEENSSAEPVLSLIDTVETTLPVGVMSSSTEIVEKTQMLAFDREYTNAFVERSERHVYTFTATERGCITYYAKHKEINNLGGWNFILYQEYFVNGVDGETAFRPLNILKSTTKAKTDGSVDIGVMPGNYRIVVEPSATNLTTLSYTLKVCFTAAADHEIECNDTKARYTELYTAVPMKGSASYFPDKQDTDWYMFRLPSQGYIDVSFEHPDMNGMTVAWKVTVTNESGYVIYAENSALSSTKLSSGKIGLKAGVYYISVAARVYTDCGYTLTVTRSNADNYETERNNTKSNADILTLNSTTYGSLVSLNETFDIDYYKFTLTDAGYITINFAHEPDENNPDRTGWNIKLTDKDGKVIYHTTSAWGHETDKSPSLGLEAGTYYIITDCEDLFHNNTTYNITVKFTASALWESEPNNSFDQADKLDLDKGINAATTVAGTEFDDDYFKFSLTEKSDITVALKSSTSAIPKTIYKLTVYDADKKIISTSDCTGAATTKLTCKELVKGTYYIKVSSALFYDTHKYTLTVSK